MSLPTEAVDRLFGRLAATYGAAWDRARGTAPVSDWKSAWGYELAGFADDLKSIAWALENLPERCPNVIEFRNLCRLSPRTDAPQLEAPTSNPAKIAAELLRLGELRAKKPEPAPAGEKEWAHRILRRHEAGEKLRPICVKFAQQALRTHLEAAGVAR